MKTAIKQVQRLMEMEFTLFSVVCHQDGITKETRKMCSGAYTAEKLQKMVI